MLDPAAVVRKALLPLDSPEMVFEVLWKMATEAKYTSAEQNAASFTLTVVAQRQRSLRTGELYSEADWDNQFLKLIRNRRKHDKNLDKSAIALLSVLENEIRREN
jgi:hypothetical protein